MSSISSISSINNQAQPQPVNQSSFAQLAQNFQAIGSALQSGDLSSAQNALAAFQQNLPGSSQTSATQPFGKNSQANTDYQSLVSALKSGNTSTAQQAYSSLQNDLKSTQSAQKTHKGHHHHHASSATAASSSTNSAVTTAATSGTSSNPTTASNGTSDGSLLNATA